MKYTIYVMLLLSTTLLSSNKEEMGKYFDQMFIHDNPKLIVDWTPKCGCTSVWVMLMKAYGLFEKAAEYSQWIHNYREDIYYKKYKVTAQKFFDPHYYKIKFVRDPYERAVSSYLHICKHTSFKKSFEDFLIMLKTKSWDNLTAHEIRTIKAHSRKQVKATDRFMNEIIPIENPNLSKTNAITGLNLCLSKHASPHHNYYEMCTQYCGDRPYITLERYPEFCCYYSLKTLELVEEIYGNDIKNYNYPVPQKIMQFLANNSK